MCAAKALKLEERKQGVKHPNAMVDFHVSYTGQILLDHFHPMRKHFFFNFFIQPYVKHSKFL